MKCSPDVSAPLDERQPALGPTCAGAGENRDDRKLPALTEREREPLRRMKTALQPSLLVRRDERERSSRFGWGDHIRDELRGQARQLAEPLVLPSGDESRDALVVRNGGASRTKGKPPTRALPAARDGPARGSTATRTEGAGQKPQPCAAARTELFARDAAGRTAAREDEVEKRAARLEPRSARTTCAEVANQVPSSQEAR
jgi:hypothetical protein